MKDRIEHLIEKAITIIQNVNLENKEDLCDAHSFMWSIYCILIGLNVISPNDYEGYINDRDFDNYDIDEEELAKNFQRKCGYFLWYCARKKLI
jgi:hypothetical protein